MIMGAHAHEFAYVSLVVEGHYAEHSASAPASFAARNARFHPAGPRRLRARSAKRRASYGAARHPRASAAAESGRSALGGAGWNGIAQISAYGKATITGLQRQRAVRRRPARRTLRVALQYRGHGLERGNLRRHDRVGARYLRRRAPLRFAVRARTYRDERILEPARLLRSKLRRDDSLRRDARGRGRRATRAARAAQGRSGRRSRDRRADASAFERNDAHGA